jgi:hypothetical protein
VEALNDKLNSTKHRTQPLLFNPTSADSLPKGSLRYTSGRQGDQGRRILKINNDRIESPYITGKIISVGCISLPLFRQRCQRHPLLPNPLMAHSRTDRPSQTHSESRTCRGGRGVKLAPFEPSRPVLGPVRPIIKLISSDTDRNI